MRARGVYESTRPLASLPHAKPTMRAKARANVAFCKTRSEGQHQASIRFFPDASKGNVRSTRPKQASTTQSQRCGQKREQMSRFARRAARECTTCTRPSEHRSKARDLPRFCPHQPSAKPPVKDVLMMVVVPRLVTDGINGVNIICATSGARL